MPLDTHRLCVLKQADGSMTDLFSFILPGSKRLITEEGIFGDNRDVLAKQPAAGGVLGFLGGGRGRARGMDSRVPDPDVVRIELSLDAAIFADGLCVGPDESGLRGSLIDQIQRQKKLQTRSCTRCEMGRCRAGFSKYFARLRGTGLPYRQPTSRDERSTIRP